MSTAIQFLETMGASAIFARMSISDYESAVALLNVDDNQRESLLNSDAKKLGDQLNGRDTLFCLVFSPDEQEDKPAPDQEGETPPEEPNAE
jgi:hypothetical protein